MDAIKDQVLLIRLESEQLSGYLGTLPEEAWRKESACDRWTVADVVAHICFGAQFYERCISRGLQGDTGPPNGFPPPGQGGPGIMGEMITQGAIGLRKTLGDQLLPTFDATSGQLHRLVSGLSPEDWNASCYHPAGLLPASVFLTLRLFELALHGWDIRSSFDPKAQPSSKSLSYVMGLVTSACRDFVKPSADEAVSGRFRFELYGPIAGNHDLVVAEGVSRLETGSSSTPGAVLRCDTGSFALLMTGRLAFEAAVSDGRLFIVDGTQLPKDFNDWFKGVWRPSSE